MSAVHFLNLTRGLECRRHVVEPRFLRIQSTWCEQKRWADVLAAATPDLLYRWAVGDEVTVHDVSERDRVTRACWQGLVWLRFCAEMTWSDQDPTVVTTPRGRGGAVVSGYFVEQYGNLPVRLVHGVRYFGQFWTGRPLAFRVCDGQRTHTYEAATGTVPSTAAVGRDHPLGLVVGGAR